VLASAPAPEKPTIGQPETDDSGAAMTPGAMLHEASLKTETREVPAKTVAAEPQPAAFKSADKPVTAAKPAQKQSADKPGLAAAQSSAAKPAHIAASTPAAQKKSVDKRALGSSKSMTKRVEVAKTDPLAPLADKHAGKPKDSPTGR
jgi:hypothetical protein